MANLRSKIVLTSDSISTDVVNNSNGPIGVGQFNPGFDIATTVDTTIGGDAIRRKVKVTDTGKKVLDSSKFSDKAYVYLCNKSTSLTINIQTTSGGGTVWFELGPGDYSFFPWSCDADLYADVTSAGKSTFLEVCIFEVAN